MKGYVSILLLTTALAAYPSEVTFASDVFIDPSLSSRYSSNVYLNQQEEWDVTLTPKLESGLDFADFWTAGYSGQLDYYFRHDDLLSHKHGLYLYTNPTWGIEGENEFFAKLSAQSQLNSSTYSSVDYLIPAINLGVTLEPLIWFRWSLSQILSFRWFYNDQSASSLDSWTNGSATFTAQTRSTFSPRIAFGYRYYTEPRIDVTEDTEDQQIETGLHFSQGLWERAGLQADYAYLRAFDDSVLVLRNMSNMEFSYIGDAFLFSGHSAEIALKQIVKSNWRFGCGLRYQTKSYSGWIVIDETGRTTGQDRQDKQLSPNLWVEVVFWPQQSASRAEPEFKASIDYMYLRQWSNDAWYDTSLHMVLLNLDLSWLL